MISKYEHIILKLREYETENVKLKLTEGHCGFYIDPSTKGNPHLEGMQIIYDYREAKKYEVSECMAGRNQNELRIYTRTNSLKVAVNSLLKGNKKRRSIEIFK